MTTRFIINHLWQSSCFVLLAELLAFVLRRNSTKIRYRVWLIASLKFLIPFALLVSLGSVVPRPPRHTVSVPLPVFPSAFAQVAEPFSLAPEATVSGRAPSLPWMPVAIGVVWALGFLAVVLARGRSWLNAQAMLRGGTPIDVPIAVRAIVTPGIQEPGIVGFMRPVLVLPARLLQYLNPRELNAILTHELCHVRRRDNLFAAVHMVVEAIFWFHPLVWWIGSRMVRECELSCDEEVLRMGCEPADYVEGILKVCRFYVESPLPCISGVTGADVKKRLRAILAGRIARELNAGKKAILAATGLVVLAVPVLIGVVQTPVVAAQAPAQTAAQLPAPRTTAPSSPVQATPTPEGKPVPTPTPAIASSPVPATPTPAPAPSFEVATIKPAAPDARGTFIRPGPGGGLKLTNMTLKDMVVYAWRIQPFQVSGGPPWLDSTHYDLEAKPETKSSPSELQAMLQTLLADRFQLRVHMETKELPIYALVLARKDGKLGPDLVETKEGSCQKFDPTQPPPPRQPGAAMPRFCGNMGISQGGLTVIDLPISELMPLLSRIAERKVVDQTGLKGNYDIDLQFPRDEAPRSPDAPPARPDLAGTLFSAFPDRLGLKFESQKGPVEAIVIDSAEKPSEN